MTRAQATASLGPIREAFRREALRELELIDEHELARLVGVSVSAVRNWRRQGTGPTPVRLSLKCVRYERAAVQKWIAEHRPKVIEPGASNDEGREK